MTSTTKRRLLSVGLLAVVITLFLGSAYAYQRSRFIQKANALFDPKERAFTGTFLPWPIGRPSLFGGFDPKTDARITASLAYESGTISSNGMTLIMHSSDGTFFVHAN